MRRGGDAEGRGSRRVFTVRRQLSRPVPRRIAVDAAAARGKVHPPRARCRCFSSPLHRGTLPLSFVTVDVVGSAQVLGVTSLRVSAVPLSFLRRVSPVSRNLLHANSVSLLRSAPRFVSVFVERAPFPLFCRAINLAKTGARRRTNEEGEGLKERALSSLQLLEMGKRETIGAETRRRRR